MSRQAQAVLWFLCLALFGYVSIAFAYAAGVAGGSYDPLCLGIEIVVVAVTCHAVSKLRQLAAPE